MGWQERRNRVARLLLGSLQQRQREMGQRMQQGGRMMQRQASQGHSQPCRRQQPGCLPTATAAAAARAAVMVSSQGSRRQAAMRERIVARTAAAKTNRPGSWVQRAHGRCRWWAQQTMYLPRQVHHCVHCGMLDCLLRLGCLLHAPQWCVRAKHDGLPCAAGVPTASQVLNNGCLTCAADLWALGCVIYQMLSGRPPFKSLSGAGRVALLLACPCGFLPILWIASCGAHAVAMPAWLPSHACRSSLSA